MTVGKMEVGGGESFEFVGFGIVNFGAHENLGNVLAVGTDVLDRGGAGFARDFAEGFDAGKILFACECDGGVPVGAAHDCEENFWRVLPTAVLGRNLWRVLPASSPKSFTVVKRFGGPPSTVTRHAERHAIHSVSDNHTVKAFVVGDGVGAAAENEEWEIFFACKIESGGDVGF